MEDSTTTVCYRGRSCDVPFCSLTNMFQCHLESFIRSEAVAHGHLQPLWCEEDIATEKTAKTLGCHKSLVSRAKAAREALRIDWG